MCTTSEFVKRFKESRIEVQAAKISKRPAVNAANNGLVFLLQLIATQGCAA